VFSFKNAGPNCLFLLRPPSAGIRFEALEKNRVLAVFFFTHYDVEEGKPVTTMKPISDSSKNSDADNSNDAS
jgi:hypothetical protein